MTKSEAGERGTFKRIGWIVAICFGSLLAIYAFGYFKWFKNNEYIALWLEGVALVFIFGLDYVNRLDDTEEHAKQHVETLTQLELLRNQGEAAKAQGIINGQPKAPEKAGTRTRATRVMACFANSR